MAATPGKPRDRPAAGSAPVRKRRDRRGRGVRGGLAPRGVPLHRSPSEAFDDLVLDAVEELEEHWRSELAGVQFAVEEVPSPEAARTGEFDSESIVDRGVPLGRLHRAGVPGSSGRPVIVVYRRPVEARAVDRDDCGDLVFMVVAELAAELLGKDPDELD